MTHLFFVFLYPGCFICVVDVDRSDAGPLHQEIETLLRKLVEAEIDGQAAAKHVVLLRQSVGKLKKVDCKLCSYLQ